MVSWLDFQNSNTLCVQTVYKYSPVCTADIEQPYPGEI